MDRDTLETIQTHIFTLGEALLDEYREDGYDADHLQPGMRVWLDGDLFRTASEVEDEIHELSSSLRDAEWVNEEGMRERLDELQEVRQLLRRCEGITTKLS